MKKIILSLFILFLIIISQKFSYSQQTFNDTVAKVTLSIPKGWEYELTDDLLTIYPESREMALTCEIINATDLEQVLTSNAEKLEELVGKISLDNPKNPYTDGIINGMLYYAMSGHSSDGRYISFTIIDTPSRKILKWLYIGSDAAADKYANELASIFNGIKPLK